MMILCGSVFAKNTEYSTDTDLSKEEGLDLVFECSAIKQMKIRGMTITDDNFNDYGIRLSDFNNLKMKMAYINLDNKLNNTGLVHDVLKTISRLAGMLGWKNGKIESRYCEKTVRYYIDSAKEDVLKLAAKEKIVSPVPIIIVNYYKTN